MLPAPSGGGSSSSGGDDLRPDRVACPGVGVGGTQLDFSSQDVI